MVRGVSGKGDREGVSGLGPHDAERRSSLRQSDYRAGISYVYIFIRNICIYIYTKFKYIYLHEIYVYIFIRNINILIYEI